MLPALRNIGALAFSATATTGWTLPNLDGEDKESAVAAGPTVDHPPAFLNPPLDDAPDGVTLFNPIGANPEVATGAKPPPPPPPINFAHPPPFFGAPPAGVAEESAALLAGATIPTPALEATEIPAAPIFLAISFASRLRSFSRRRSDSPDAFFLESSSAFSAIARARW